MAALENLMGLGVGILACYLILAAVFGMKEILDAYTRRNR